MPQPPTQQPSQQPSPYSQGVVFLGMLAVFGSLMLIVVTNIPTWLALLGGSIVGGAILIVGFSLDKTTQSKPFWPSAESLRTGSVLGIWNTLLVATFLGPIIAFAVLFLLIPAGDSWPLAILRITMVATQLAIVIGWLKYCKTVFGKWFQGRASLSLIEQFTKPAPEVPFTWRKFLQENSWMLIAASLAFAVFFGAIDFNGPFLQLQLDGPRRLRGLARVLAWCRGNPNTINSSAFVAGIGCLAAFAYTTSRAWKQSKI